MRAFLSIIGLLLVIAGFVVLSIKRRKRKDKSAVTVGIVEQVEKKEDLYLLHVRYKPAYAEEILKGEVCSKKNYIEGAEVVLNLAEDDLTVYTDDRRLLFLAFFLLVMGGLLCVIA